MMQLSIKEEKMGEGHVVTATTGLMKMLIILMSTYPNLTTIPIYVDGFDWYVIEAA